MAYRKIEDAKLTAIAEEIRTQLSITQTLTVDEMPGMIKTIGSNIVPDYWKITLVSRENTINSALSEARSDRSAFLWYTDAHWTTNYGTSPRLLKHLSTHTNMTKTFFGGDVATAKSGEIAELTAWQEQVKNIPNHHSVLGNHDNQVTELASNSDKSNFFFGPEDKSGVVFGTSATDGMLYYYIDDSTEKTRYICLSTGRMWTSADEVLWCINTLNSTPANWHIVVISHLWLNMDYSGSSAVLITTPVDYSQVYLNLFDAYNHREKGTASLHGSSYNFTGGKAKVEFVIGGHIHQDYDFTSTRGIPVILTECDSYQERDDVSVANKGTTTESCVYGVIADYGAKKVKVLNVGRGDTRSILIPDINIEVNPDEPGEEETTITNWVKLAYSGADKTIYNNGKGYKEDTRSSSGTDTAATGWDVTGYIPVRLGDTIRFKNCSVYELSGASTYNRMHFDFFDESFGYLVCSASYSKNNPPSTAWSPVHDDNGDLIQVSVPTAYTSAIRYVRITMDDINENSIITVNEVIDAPDTPTTSYTNVLPLATAADGSIYNGTGYKSATRLSTSSGDFVEKTETGWCTSGIIPAKKGDTIRLKNCKFAVTNTVGGSHRAGIYGVASNGSYSGYMMSMSSLATGASSSSPVFDTDNDNIVQFKVPNNLGDIMGIRIVAQEFIVNSIITVNEEID